MKSWIGLVLVGTMLLQGAGVARGDALSEHATASSISQSNVALGSAPTLTIHLLKPKKHQMLIVQGTVLGNSSTASFAAYVSANGVFLEPGLLTQKCSGACTLAGTLWMDLDDAEAANPGMILNGAPLTVVMSPSSTGAVNGTVSMTATLVKAK